MCDLCRKTFVVHQQKVDFPYVADQKFLQAAGEEVAGLYNGFMNLMYLALAAAQDFTFLLLP